MSPSRLTAATMALLCVAVTAGCAPSAPRPHEPVAAIVAQDDLRDFVVPLASDVPPDLIREQDDSRLVTWRLVGTGDDVIHLMAPTTVRPDGSTPRPAPSRYAAYLRGLAARGARIADTGDGRLLVTVPRAIEAGLGCWSPAAADCFSLSPGATLLVATVTLRGWPVVLCARTWQPRPSARLTAAFDRVLDTLTPLD